MKAFLVFVSITLSVISIVQSAAAPNSSSNTQQQVKTSSEVASAYTTLLTQPITTDGWFYFTNFLSQYIPTFIGNNYQLHDELKEPLKSFKYVCLMMELLAKMDLYRNQPQGAIIRAKKMSTMYLKVITNYILEQYNLLNAQIEDAVQRLVDSFKWDEAMFSFGESADPDKLKKFVNVVYDAIPKITFGALIELFETYNKQ